MCSCEDKGGKGHWNLLSEAEKSFIKFSCGFIFIGVAGNPGGRVVAGNPGGRVVAGNPGGRVVNELIFRTFKL